MGWHLLLAPVASQFMPSSAILFLFLLLNSSADTSRLTMHLAGSQNVAQYAERCRAQRSQTLLVGMDAGSSFALTVEAALALCFLNVQKLGPLTFLQLKFGLLLT